MKRRFPGIPACGFAYLTYDCQPKASPHTSGSADKIPLLLFFYFQNWFYLFNLPKIMKR